MSNELLPYFGGLLAIFSSFFGSFASGGSVLILLSTLLIVSPAPYLTLLATTKTAGAAMVLVSSSLHLKKTRVNYSMIAVMTVMGMIGMFVATYLVQNYPNEVFFERMIGLLLVGFGLYLLLSKSSGLQGTGRTHFTPKEFAEAGAVLLLVGFINAFAGGIGMILNVYLVLRLKMNFIEATAYTMISGLFVIVTQAFYLVYMTAVNPLLLALVILGSLIGGYFGTQMQYIKGNQVVKWAVTFMMLVLGTVNLLH